MILLRILFTLLITNTVVGNAFGQTSPKHGFLVSQHLVWNQYYAGASYIGIFKNFGVEAGIQNEWTLTNFKYKRAFPGIELQGFYRFKNLKKQHFLSAGINLMYNTRNNMSRISGYDTRHQRLNTGLFVQYEWEKDQFLLQLSTGPAYQYNFAYNKTLQVNENKGFITYWLQLSLGGIFTP